MFLTCSCAVFCEIYLPQWANLCYCPDCEMSPFIKPIPGLDSSGACSTGNTLRWRHNERDGISNHQAHDCLLNHLFRCRSRKRSKLCITGLCAGNSLGTGEFPAQMASKVKKVSIWWRHHDFDFLLNSNYDKTCCWHNRNIRGILSQWNFVFTKKAPLFLACTKHRYDQNDMREKM